LTFEPGTPHNVVVHKVVLLNAVGLTPRLIGKHTPVLTRMVERGGLTPLQPPIPAVTCTVQASMLTGVGPGEHGIVGNGWYFRDTAEVRFWQQSASLLQIPRVWTLAKARDPGFTCANLFWWHAMYSGTDVTVTPRPIYHADGRKTPDIWTAPPKLRQTLQQKLGQFPLFKFWGPGTSIDSTRWIADAAIESDRLHDCTLTLVYLPHLDYCLQRDGPEWSGLPQHLAELDREIDKLEAHFEAQGARCLVVSEYGITPVRRVILPNLLLRRAGLLSLRDEAGRDMLDAGASRAFAVVDHQLAHIYVRDSADVARVVKLLEAEPGVARVFTGTSRGAVGLEHPRAGEVIAISEPDAWFAWNTWEDSRRAPDFARTVDIHRKPGYDPCELFIDPRFRLPRLSIGWRLLRRKLGFRSLLDVIPLDPTLVRGSHGALPILDDDAPVLIGAGTGPRRPAQDIRDVLLSAIFGE
jgi:predicted AlkP superfamily pyrophosphatase or phosphodiesterase